MTKEEYSNLLELQQKRIAIEEELRAIGKRIYSEERSRIDEMQCNEEFSATEKQVMLEELCQKFGHDVVESARKYEIVTCKCCGKLEHYYNFIKDWENAPLHDAVFPRPSIKEVEVAYRSDSPFISFDIGDI